MKLLYEDDPAETNMDPESVIVRDTLTARKTPYTETVKVGDKSASKRDVEQDPGKYFPQWFNPDRNEHLPSHVSEKRRLEMRRSLRDLDGRLDIIWHPLREVWQVYIRNENIQSWWTKGWERIFMIEPYGDVVTKCRAKLYFMRPEVFGKGKVEADRILYERELERRKFNDELDDDAKMKARDIYQSGLIKNIGKGSKFSEMYD